MKNWLLLVGVLVVGVLKANTLGDRITARQYIDNWKSTAIDHMKRYGIPASITLAQGMLESANGNSELAKNANNHFGIKCHGWQGAGYYHDDDRKNECFRKYSSAEESFADHAEFLSTKQRYASLFSNGIDYKAWAHGLKKAGYATNPQYPQLIIKTIEDNQLYLFDNGKDLPEIVEKQQPLAQVDKKQSKKQTAAKPVKKKKVTQQEVEITLGRSILLHENNIKYIEAKKGDTPEKIANDLNLGLWQILKYNDLEKGTALEKGSTIYIQPKRRKAQIENYTLKNNETLEEVSQRFGIKMKFIYKRNGLEKGATPKAGTVLRLR